MSLPRVFWLTHHPAIRCLAGTGLVALDFDRRRRELVLCSGFQAAHQALAEVWRLREGVWRRAEADLPLPLEGALMAWGSIRQRLVVAGGIGGEGQDFRKNEKTWVWDGRGWQGY